jgi:hypothetical protein
MDSYALLESAHEIMVTTVKDSQAHTCTCAQPSIDLSCANSFCSQGKPSCDEHVLVETCDSFITSENDELKRENEMVKKLEKESTVTCAKLPQIYLKTYYQKVDKPKIKKKAQIKCFKCSTL